MTRNELIAAIGKTVRVSSDRDLYFEGGLRPILSPGGLGPLVTVVKLSKGGMAVVRAADGREYAVPPRNVVNDG